MALNNKSSKPVLTIAIPTYNRERYLDRCLKGILIQYIENIPIEIIVSDNNSTDNTETIVKKYRGMGLPIRYIKNSKNEGPDYNVGQCYWEAKGEFVLCLGDDDILVNNAIEKILVIIEENNKEIGIIHLKPRAFRKDYTKEISIKNSKKKYSIFYNNVFFLKKISYYSTFISSNIVNTKFIGRKDDLLKNKGSYFIHLPSILKAIVGSEKNIYIEDFFLAGQLDNSGGYDYFKTFTENIYRIYIEKVGEPITNIIMRKVVQEHLPNYIILFREKKMENYRTNPALNSTFLKKYYSYWFFNYPLSSLPYSLAKRYYLFIRIFNKLRRVLRDMKEPFSSFIVYKKL